MRSVASFASAIVLAASLAACSPFSMENEQLGLAPPDTDYHVQSYYLPKTILMATVTSTGKVRNIKVGVEKVVDRDYLFRVNYERSILHEDELHVETSPKGFLTEVKAFSTDKTADIIEAASKILMTSISDKPSSLRSLPTEALPETQLVVVQFDPFDPNDFGVHNRLLARTGFCFAVFDREDRPLKGSCNAASVRAHDDAWHGSTHPAQKWRGAGFFYRRSVEHRVVIYRGHASSWTPIWSGWHQFEQMGDLRELRIDRGAFIKHEATLNFSEGQLTKYTMKKPSELLGFMAIPSTVVNTIVQLPGLQVTAAEGKNALRERELNAREKELQLRERELKLAGTTADGNRLVYLADSSATRSAGGDVISARSLSDDKIRFMRDCADQKGLTSQDCDDAWQKRMRN